ncbi:chemotaxis protein CheW [Pradoshia sp. D12]|uniref:chemotaxis protein CheW n=1 Tax=Bacillaceae TaxID=186817 RepID=UPI0011232D29|nr:MULTISPECIES: chemotaxis protein CheW [Bacillaceae]QFK71000.1 chemotaxis protein CheW [Pradoshia sp. D12]TPF72792.1 chemotaxis protein CheW [Bacillus sp. D12]
MADNDNRQMQKVIVFELVNKEYAIPVEYVLSIEKVSTITRVPGVEPFVMGVINLKGTITPIIDLRMRFGLEQKEYDESSRIIIISFNEFEVGLIVDSARDVLEFPADLIEPQPKVIGMQEIDFINGVVKVDKRLLILIKLERILQVLGTTQSI